MFTSKNQNSPYKQADDFFKASQPYALTYDDVSLATSYSEVLPKDTQLETALSERLSLAIPIISSDMDTVTESRMAIAMALQGGLGLIHYNMSNAKQLKEVARVKNHLHGVIQDPIKVSADSYIGDILEMIEAKRFKFSTFPVVDEKGKLLGLLSGQVVKHRYKGKKVHEGMTPRSEVFTINQKKLGKDPIGAADRFFMEHMGIHKLLIVDDEDQLCGLFTLSDVERIQEEASRMLKPARDELFRLRCGVAISTPRMESGELDKEKIVQHVENLLSEGVDAVAVSTAHGFSAGVGQAVKLIRQNFKDLTIIAGNVTSPEGVEFLAKAGADAIKIGQGPGSICTTRVVAGVGIPQLTALYESSKAAKKHGVKILADGGINKSGDIVKALTLSDAVICGGILAGCKEAPGKIIEINGKFYKEYRGMGSLEAMKAGSAARYGHEAKDFAKQAAAQGVEALKEVQESVEGVLTQLVGGIQAGLGYLGAKNLSELQDKARYVRVTASGQREAATHDIIELKTSLQSE